MNQYIVGRDRTCDIIPHGDISTMSTRHLLITELPGGGTYTLRDLGSLNGSFILRSGRWECFTTTTCRAGDTLLLGQYQTTVERLLDMVRPQERIHRGHSVRAEDGHITFVKRRNL